MNIWEQAARGQPSQTEHRLTDKVRESDVANEAIVMDRIKAAIAAKQATEDDAVRIFGLGSVAEKLKATDAWANLVKS